MAVSPWTFVRLKLRLTANGLRGRSGRIVLFVLGVALGLFFAVDGFFVLALPGLFGSERAAAAVLPLGGAAITAGWLVVPLVFFGMDESLDPARFALLPLRRRTLVAGLTAAALAGVPALATLVALLGMVVTAARIGGPVAACAEVVGVLLGLLLSVVLSRAAISAFAGALRSRRARDLATVLLALTAALLGPLQLLLLTGAQHADWDRAGTVARIVSWTPLGSAYGLGLDLPLAPVRLLISLIALAGLVFWWRSTLETAMQGGSSAGRHDTANDSRPPVASLLLRGLPRTRFGALVAREVRYWWRETRRRASLITYSVASLFVPLSLALGGATPGGMATFVGALASIALANQFGTEGTAYAANIVAGVPGRLEIQSRATAHAVYSIPLFVLIAVAVGVVSGHPGTIASTLGLLIAAYGVGLGLVLPLSVRAAYALPETTNPFALSSGGGMAKGLLALAVLVGAFVVTVPLLAMSYTLGVAWSFLALPVGSAYGFAGYLIGSGVAGDQLDRRMPELLSTITPNRA